MDLKSLAYEAVDNAVTLIKDGKVEANTELSNGAKQDVKAYLINGEIVTKENLSDKLKKMTISNPEDVYKYCK